MEEKELNFCELLKGCEGEKFYSSAFGNIRLEEIQVNNLVFKEENNKVVDELFQTDSEGVHSINGMTIIFPSRALYEKYPLDAKKAWDEWQESRKPKRWTPNLGDEYFSVSGNAKVLKLKHFGNEVDKELEIIHNRFRTEEEAQQAAEIVKEALQKFYEKNSKK